MVEENKNGFSILDLLDLDDSGSRITPKSQNETDALILVPQNNTSFRNKINVEKNRIEPVRTRAKNINSIDLATANFSESQVLAAGLGGMVSSMCQMITEYFETDDGKKEPIKYDLTVAQNAFADMQSVWCTSTKSGKLVGSSVLRLLRSDVRPEKTDYYKHLLEQVAGSDDEKKKGVLTGWKK